MQKRVLPIVYASDENFLQQTYVSIFSVLANREKKYIIEFLILVPEGCKIEYYDKKWDFVDYSIEYRFVSPQYFQNVKMVLQNISKPTYYRLLIPLFLPNYDVCIYLDGDTICCRDIWELYEVEIGDNLLAASMGAMLPFDASYWAQVLELPSGKYYVNAGVLVMNLKQIRIENKMNEFLKCSERKLPCQDQDVLNICCYNRIKLLPLKYNVYNTAFNMPVETLLERFNRFEIQEATSNPVIIHYPGEFSKPWNNIQCVKSREWWNYATQVLDSDTVSKMHRKAIERMSRYSYYALFEKIANCSQIVIFGFSEVGQRFCDEVDEKYPGKIVGFCDNAKEKWGEMYKNYRVMNIDAIRANYSNALIVITSQNYSDAIQKQLLEAKFDLNNLVIYRMKTLNYIYSMDRVYWEEVRKDISLDEISWNECHEININCERGEKGEYCN